MPVIWEKDGSRMDTTPDGSLDAGEPVGIADIELKDGSEYRDSGSVRYRVPKPECGLAISFAYFHQSE